MMIKEVIFPALVISMLTLVLFSCGTKESEPEAFAWPGWRGPNGDGISMETNWDTEALSGGAKILWKKNIGIGYSNVAIKDGRLYTMGAKSGETSVICLNAETGKEIWRYTFVGARYESRSTPAVDGDRVYGLDSHGTLVCLNTKNGKVLWKTHLKDDLNARKTTAGWATSPVVVKDLLLLNANTVAIALDKNTGDLIWSITDEVPSGSWGSYATTVVYDFNGSTVALFMGPSTLNAIEVETGRKLWSYEHGDNMHPAADPVVIGNKVFVSLPEWCGLLEITDTAPEEIWSSTALVAFTPTVLLGGYLYGSSSFEHYVTSWSGMRRLDWPFRCISMETGTLMWEKSMGMASLIAADGKLIILEIDGTLRIAEATPSSFKELSRADVLGGEKQQRIFATPPVLYDGKIYCRKYSGDLICIDVSK